MENEEGGTINNYLKKILFVGTAWDSIGGVIFLFVHGFFQIQLTPDIHPFYAIVTGLFLFFLAYIQYICTGNIQTNIKNIGAVVLFRIFYGISVILFSLQVEILPMQFFIIASVDIILVVLLLVFSSMSGKFTLAELF